MNTHTPSSIYKNKPTTTLLNNLSKAIVLLQTNNKLKPADTKVRSIIRELNKRPETLTPKQSIKFNRLKIRFSWI